MTHTIYADSNIYRYVSTGELEIMIIGSIRFAYSSVHFDEMIRSGNTEMLRGIEVLGAVPLVTNENGEYDVDDIGVCLEYENPYEKFNKYKKEVEPLGDDAEALISELLLRLLGADNYEELRNTPASTVEMVLNAFKNEDVGSENLLNKIRESARDFGEFIENDLSAR